MEEYPNKITYRSFRYVLGAVLTYSVGSFYFGYCLSYFNSIEFKHIYEIFHINMPIKQAEGLFSGCVSFGALFGAYFSSYIINKYSRRESFIIVGILTIISYIFISIQSALSLLCGRFLQGFCVGVYSSLVPLVIRQISPLQLSGSFGAIISPAIGCGFFSSYLLSYILNKYLPTAYYWYIVFLFPITIIILQLFLLCKIYTNQTPKYLILQGKIQQAKQLITIIYKDQYIEKILNEKIIDFQKNTKNIAVTVEVQQMEQIESNQTQKQKYKQNVLDQKQKQDVFQSEVNLQEKQNVQGYPKDVKIAKIYAFILQIFHQFSGISIATIYGAHLAKQAIHSLQAQIPLIINGGKIIAGLSCTLLLKRYGRRFLMLRGLIIILIVLICLAIGFSIKTPQSQSIQIFITICLLTFVSTFVMTQGPITWLYIPQIIQPPTIPYISMVNWICGCIVITTFPMLQDKIQNLFIFFAICTFIHVILCYFCMVETKDKKQVQIRKQFINVQTRMKNIWNRIKIQMRRNQDH